MISAKEKREQMSMEYWHGVMRKQVAAILEHTNADEKYVQFQLDVPKRFTQEIWEELYVELTTLGYEAIIIDDAPDAFAPQIFVRWSK